MENDHEPVAGQLIRHIPWNKGKIVGAKPPLRPSHVWSIRTKLQMEGRKRGLALFNLAIDSKLRGCDVVAIRVDDVAPSGYAMDRATIRQRKTGRPKLATHLGTKRLVSAMSLLRAAFEAKSEEFTDIVKMGRTQLQDAEPTTLGQEFSAHAVMLAEDEQRLEEALLLICEINLGATAIGTGINAHPDYARLVCENLRAITAIPVETAPNLVEATQDCGSFVQLSSVLKRVAIKLSKTCNDLRLLSSGPRAGFGEINLPPMQAGSSIMPGKVNPVIPEVVNQIAFEVIGNDLTISFAAAAGQLQPNASEPIIGYSLFKSIGHLRSGCLTLAERCVEGISQSGASGANCRTLNRNCHGA